MDVSSFNAINQIIEEKEEYSESSHSDYETSSLTLWDDSWQVVFLLLPPSYLLQPREHQLVYNGVQYCTALYSE